MWLVLSEPGDPVGPASRQRRHGSLPASAHRLITSALMTAAGWLWGSGTAGVGQAELAGRQAVGGTERAVEVRGADEAPAGGRGGHRPGRQGRVEQVTAGSVQPTLPDQGGHAPVLGLEQL